MADKVMLVAQSFLAAEPGFAHELAALGWQPSAVVEAVTFLVDGQEHRIPTPVVLYRRTIDDE